MPFERKNRESELPRERTSTTQKTTIISVDHYGK